MQIIPMHDSIAQNKRKEPLQIMFVCITFKMENFKNYWAFIILFLMVHPVNFKNHGLINSYYDATIYVAGNAFHWSHDHTICSKFLDQ